MQDFDRAVIREYYTPTTCDKYMSPDWGEQTWTTTTYTTRPSYIKVKSNLHIRKARGILYRRMIKSVCSK